MFRIPFSNLQCRYKTCSRGYIIELHAACIWKDQKKDQE